MSIHTQLCSFKTAEHERLHGLLFTPAGAAPNGSCKLVHGANHFYNRHMPEIVDIINQWLSQFVD